MKKFILTAVLFYLATAAFSQFSVSANKHFLLKNGKPFFWLGDTAWELFHRLSREEAIEYLKKRSEQGFTVIQAVALAERDGLNVGNAYGDRPLLDNDPTRPNEAYFQHVDFIVKKAEEFQLTIALLPTWGDKVFTKKWGAGPEIFDSSNAAAFGHWIGDRYKESPNIIWVLGGDRLPRGEADIAIWNAMGRAIMEATDNRAIISYHPEPCASGSAEWFHQADWLSFNMFQTGHCRDIENYKQIQSVYSLQPAKPVMDAEPIYEDHPVCFNADNLGTSSAYDVRKAAYTDLFAGAFGHTYGCHDIWQMYAPGRVPINGPHKFWFEALTLPGAEQMKYLRRLIESRPMLDRIPDQTIIRENDLNSSQRIQATRGKDYAFIYTSQGLPFTLYLDRLSIKKMHAYWFNPRNGAVTDAGEVKKETERKFQPPSTGYGQDWVLIIDDAKTYKVSFQ